MVTVAGYPQNQPVSTFYFGVIMASTVLSSFMSTVQFVSISAFMTSIADPIIGGTYMTVSLLEVCSLSRSLLYLIFLFLA